MKVSQIIIGLLIFILAFCFMISCSQQGAEINSACETEDGAILVKNPANSVKKGNVIITIIQNKDKVNNNEN